MEPRFETQNEKRFFIGKRLKMSFAGNKTFELWRQFMPRRPEIKNVAGIELYSIEVYPPDFFRSFNPTMEFEKWAAVEVTELADIPHDLETLVITAGLYAVFLYRGKASEAGNFYRYIFADWLPKSDFLLEERPHLAVMGEKYKNDSDDSEEEIWIPVKSKTTSGSENQTAETQSRGE